jgi:hypothetical protein
LGRRSFAYVPAIAIGFAVTVSFERFAHGVALVACQRLGLVPRLFSRR